MSLQFARQLFKPVTKPLQIVWLHLRSRIETLT